ncbi:phospholipid scramblase-related protein [Saccharopolyspora sp. NPDC002376]
MNAPAPGWYPDQADQRYVRWWDGRQWTQHVQPAQAPAPQPQSDANAVEMSVGGTGNAASIQHQVQQHAGVGGPVAGGGGTLFTEPVLVINQQAKLIEMSNEYAIYDQHGRQIGAVVQVGQSGAQKALRAFTKLDSMMTVKLEIRDITGRPVLLLTRPATLWKGTVQVKRPDQSPIGEIRLANFWGKARFNFEIGGQRIGGLQAENLRAWDIKVLDQADQPIGQISKTWQGLAKAAFTTADNYVLQIHRPLQDPLQSMVLASALTFDTIFSQHQ